MNMVVFTIAFLAIEGILLAVMVPFYQMAMDRRIMSSWFPKRHQLSRAILSCYILAFVTMNVPAGYVVLNSYSQYEGAPENIGTIEPTETALIPTVPTVWDTLDAPSVTPQAPVDTVVPEVTETITTTPKVVTEVTPEITPIIPSPIPTETPSCVVEVKVQAGARIRRAPHIEAPIVDVEEFGYMMRTTGITTISGESWYQITRGGQIVGWTRADIVEAEADCQYLSVVTPPALPNRPTEPGVAVVPPPTIEPTTVVPTETGVTPVPTTPVGTIEVTETPKPETTSEATPEPTPTPTEVETTPEQTEEATRRPIETTPEVTSEPTHEATPETTPEPTVQVTPETTSETTPELTPEPTLEATVEPTLEVTEETTPAPVTETVTATETPELVTETTEPTMTPTSTATPLPPTATMIPPAATSVPPSPTVPSAHPVISIINPAVDNTAVDVSILIEAVAYDASINTVNGTNIAYVQFEIYAPDGRLIRNWRENVVRYCGGSGDNQCSPTTELVNSGQTGTFRVRAMAVTRNGFSSAWVERTFIINPPIQTQQDVVVPTLVPVVEVTETLK